MCSKNNKTYISNNIISPYLSKLSVNKLSHNRFYKNPKASVILIYFVLITLYANKAQPNISSKPPIGVTGARKETENGKRLLSARKYKEPEKKNVPKTKNLKTPFTFFISNPGINAKANKANA